jgi:hypothetical protein
MPGSRRLLQAAPYTFVKHVIPNEEATYALHGKPVTFSIFDTEATVDSNVPCAVVTVAYSNDCSVGWNCVRLRTVSTCESSVNALRGRQGDDAVAVSVTRIGVNVSLELLPFGEDCRMSPRRVLAESSTTMALCLNHEYEVHRREDLSL